MNYLINCSELDNFIVVLWYLAFWTGGVDGTISGGMGTSRESVSKKGLFLFSKLKFPILVIKVLSS